MQSLADSDYDFTALLAKHPDSPLASLGIDKIQEAARATLERLDVLRARSLEEAADKAASGRNFYLHGSAAINVIRHIIPDLITGMSPSDILEGQMMQEYKKENPEKYAILLAVLPTLLAALGLRMPESPAQRKLTLLSTSPDCSEWLAKNPDSPLQRLGAEKINAALLHAAEHIDALYEKSIEGVTDGNTRGIRRHEHGGAAIYVTKYMIRDLIEGKPPEQIVQAFAKELEFKKPEKWEVMKYAAIGFFRELDLAVPQRLFAPPGATVVIIDDSLGMDLKERRIDCRPEDIFSNPNRPVKTWYARSKAEAENILRIYHNLDKKPDAIICDYKLHLPGEPEVWGDRLLGELFEKYDVYPRKVFLISKSGFGEEDKEQLKERGIVYAHSNELHALAAVQAKDEQNIAFCTGIATTSVLREWTNANLGTDCPTNRYVSPNIADMERGRLLATEVVRRAASRPLEAYPLLDMDSIGRAFRPRVDDKELDESQKASLPPGVKGPSFQGRLALSKDGIAMILAEDAKTPVLLVLNQDYSASDNGYLNDIRGLVLLKRGTRHIDTAARNKNIPVAFARGAGSAVLSVRGGTLYAHDRGLEPIAFAKEGDAVTFDGERLLLCKGHVPLIQPDPEEKEAVRRLAAMAAKHIGNNWHVRGAPDQTGVKVRITIDSARDLQQALELRLPFNGVGLFRTERDLLESTTGLQALQGAVLGDGEAKARGLADIRNHSEASFRAIFVAAKGQKAAPEGSFPITVRLLDAPAAEAYHDPGDAAAIRACAARLEVDESEIRRRSEKLHDQSQLRGAGFALAHPELYDAQCDALFKTAKETGAEPHILIPNIRTPEELEAIKSRVEEAALRQGMNGKYKFGAMLETSEVVLQSAQDEAAKGRVERIVQACDFVSFGTNDLTEELLRLKRGDPDALAKWQHDKQNPFDPFAVLDDTVKNAIHHTEAYIHSLKPLMPLSICGRHASSPADAGFFQEHHIASISVPPTEEAICSGLIQSAGAALQSSVAGREGADAATAARRLPKGPAAEAVELQSGVQVPYPKTLKKSDVAFLYIEDDRPEAARLAQELEGQPIVIAPSVAEGLRTIESLRREGKKIVLISDMELPFGDEAERKALMAQHSWIGGYDEQTKKWGVEFANAAQAGRIPGVEPGNVRLMTAGEHQYYNLSGDVQVMHKLDRFEEACMAMMVGYTEQSQQERRSVRGGLPPDLS